MLTFPAPTPLLAAIGTPAIVAIVVAAVLLLALIRVARVVSTGSREAREYLLTQTTAMRPLLAARGVQFEPGDGGQLRQVRGAQQLEVAAFTPGLASMSYAPAGDAPGAELEEGVTPADYSPAVLHFVAEEGGGLVLDQPGVIDAERLAQLEPQLERMRGWSVEELSLDGRYLSLFVSAEGEAGAVDSIARLVEPGYELHAASLEVLRGWAPAALTLNPVTASAAPTTPTNPLTPKETDQRGPFM
ncbi:MAG: hypothetical protein JWO69_480 [Thermoleophilia bacterium]|nr:hypothetical protein [Thermoleophilia bacterium]